MNEEHLAKEAQRLKQDEVFNFALEEIRKEALNDLASVKPDASLTIAHLQAKVAVIDEIRTTLDRYILRISGRGQAGEAFPFA